VHIVEFCCAGQTVMSSCEGVEDMEILLKITIKSFVFINHVTSQGIVTEHSLLIASFNKHYYVVKKFERSTVKTALSHFFRYTNLRD